MEIGCAAHPGRSRKLAGTHVPGQTPAKIRISQSPVGAFVITLTRMLSLDTVTSTDFEARLHETFHLVLHDGKFSFELVAVRPLGGAAPGAKRKPFAITLRASQSIRLPQATYRLENEVLGPIDIFLVQHAPAEVEAIFN
jgi:hypothetical protein